MATFTGKVVAKKLNVQVEKSGGDGTFEAHKFKIELDSGKGKLFTVSVKAAPAPYIEKLNKGDNVTVTTSGKFDSVVKVAKPYTGGKGGYSGGGGGYKKGVYTPRPDNTAGMICGMVLKAAIDIALASELPDDPKAKVKAIVAAAGVVLSARTKVDALVKQALKTKTSDDDDLEDDADEEDVDDDETETKSNKSAKKSKKAKDNLEEDDADEESDDSEDEDF